MNSISEEEFKALVNLVYQESGIVLNNKRELVDARLASLSRKEGYKSPGEFLRKLKSDHTGESLVELLDQVSTNLTYFYREPAHFEFLSKVLLPDLIAAKKHSSQPSDPFLSAACSSGEEPYSLAMTVLDKLGDASGWDFKILATDISTKMLRKGIQGRYTRQEVLRAPPDLISRYFHRVGIRNSRTTMWPAEVKKRVAFRRLNLLQTATLFRGCSI